MKAVISDRIYLTVTPNQQRKIDRELTYAIPSYRFDDPPIMIKNMALIRDGLIAIPSGRTDLIPTDHEIVDKRSIKSIKFPPFKDISLRYLSEVSIHKKCCRDERYTINTFSREAWSEYPINKITPLIIGRYRDKQRETIKDNTINRKLDVISTIYTTCKKEWGYPVINPVLSIRRPKMPEVRTRRLSEREINLLLKGNRTSETLRTIIDFKKNKGEKIL